MIIDGLRCVMVGAKNPNLSLANLLKYELLKRHYSKFREEDFKTHSHIANMTPSNKLTRNYSFLQLNLDSYFITSFFYSRM